MKFDSVIGNKDVKDYLRKNLETNNILHSYMFLGTEGIGKLKLAKEFAKFVLCLKNREENCNCKACLCYESGNHPDFLLINEQGQTISVEEVRKIINKITEKPIVSDRKVYIINDFEKMTKEGQNCLLKTLEEPPEYACLILISANENRILNTIKSRCMKVKFRNIENDVLYKYAVENLGYSQISDNLLKTFDGSIGKAISLKENQEKYYEIEQIINSFEREDITTILANSKIIYDKLNIEDILDYMIVSIYEKSKTNKRYLNCIKYVSQTFERLKANGNLDMNIDSLLLNIWEELNEKSCRN